MNRRQFLIKNGLFSFGTLLVSVSGRNVFATSDWAVKQDFPGAGGTIDGLDIHSKKILFRPHNEEGGGWGQVWWYFRVEGLTPGDTLTLQLGQDVPPGEGIAPQAYYSYDQREWKMSAEGAPITEQGVPYFVYRQQVSKSTVWFAYNIPYLPEHQEPIFESASRLGREVELFELCRTRAGRPVPALRVGKKTAKTPKPHVWLQARSHAFESGGSWVLHELTMWLLSSDPQAKRLRSKVDFTIVPIVDVDGVVEGRTGKNHPPHDHNRDWQSVPPVWVETTGIKLRLKELTENGSLALFMDIHGPATQSHPYFISAADSFLNTAQQQRQRAFFAAMGADEMNKEAGKTQSMDHFHYSLRPINPLTAAGWAVGNTTREVITFTLEVNMNTPLSSHEGYRKQGIALGRGLESYFRQNR
jgi:hypothetical protein